jgi:hypothetical protein
MQPHVTQNKNIFPPIKANSSVGGTISMGLKAFCNYFQMFYIILLFNCEVKYHLHLVPLEVTTNWKPQTYFRL